MNYKTLFQLFLVILALIISLLFYLVYFDKSQSKKNLKQNNISEENETKLSQGNTVKEILYETNDNNGNRYIIKSDSGTFSEENKDEIYMVNVTAEINLKNGANIYLKSKNAIYNTINSDTNFFNNVVLDYLDHKLNAKNIDIFFEDSKLEAYNDLIYKNLDINLIADKVEMDLLTRDSKIFMFDNSQVKIIKE